VVINLQGARMGQIGAPRRAPEPPSVSKLYLKKIRAEHRGSKQRKKAIKESHEATTDKKSRARTPMSPFALSRKCGVYGTGSGKGGEERKGGDRGG